MAQAKSPEQVVQEIRRKTRRRCSAEEKIRQGMALIDQGMSPKASDEGSTVSTG